MSFLVRLLFAGLALAANSLVAAQTTAPATTDTSSSPYFAVSNAEPGVDALPLKATRVEVEIAGVIADVRVTQVYRNEGNRPLEARYVFPASTRAAVYALRMRIGERTVDAEIREKQQARREYAQAKQEGRSAALLEQHRPNVFQMRLANVLPGDEIAVDLRYTETIVPTDGTYRFVYPTVVGPRYNGGRTENGAATESHRPEPWIAQPTLRAGVAGSATFALEATIRAPLPVQAVVSPSHAIDSTGIGTDRATVAPGAGARAREPRRGHRLSPRAARRSTPACSCTSAATRVTSCCSPSHPRASPRSPSRRANTCSWSTSPAR